MPWRREPDDGPVEVVVGPAGHALVVMAMSGVESRPGVPAGHCRPLEERWYKFADQLRQWAQPYYTMGTLCARLCACFSSRRHLITQFPSQVSKETNQLTETKRASKTYYELLTSWQAEGCVLPMIPGKCPVPSEAPGADRGWPTSSRRGLEGEMMASALPAASLQART